MTLRSASSAPAARSPGCGAAARWRSSTLARRSGLPPHSLLLPPCPGRRKTASCRARWAGRSSSRAVISRIRFSRDLRRRWPGHGGGSAPRARQIPRPLRASAGGGHRGRCRGTCPLRVSLLTPAMREALPSDGMPSSPALATIAFRRFDQKTCRSSGMPSMRVSPPSGPYCSMRHTEALAEVPGERIAVDRTRCLGPAVDRVLVHAPATCRPPASLRH